MPRDRLKETSIFQDIEILPSDPVLSLPLLFAKDDRPFKVDLGVGSYKNDAGQSIVLTSVLEAEKNIFNKQEGKNYQAIEGSSYFIEPTIELIYGKNCEREKIILLQTVGGTNALKIAGEFFLAKGLHKICIPNPSWPTHELIFKRIGLEVSFYSYYDSKSKTFNFISLCQDLKKLTPNTVVLLHGGCHNPTGFDLSKDEWKTLCELIKEYKLFPLFDLAYQGFALGIEEDAFAIRHFAKEQVEMAVATSFSKNMGLYGERAGSLSFFIKDKKILEAIFSHLKQIVRSNYSNPPLHPARLVGTILNSNELKNLWMQEVDQMKERIHEMRQLLKLKLIEKNVKTDLGFMDDQQGMFSMIGLTPQNAAQLEKDYAIYMLKNGRISIPGLTLKNIDYVAEAISKIL